LHLHRLAAGIEQLLGLAADDGDDVLERVDRFEGLPRR
jgi:hypothetical protein